MPFIAYHNGKKKAPRQVPKDEEAECPVCGDVVTVRGPYEDGRARHFWHSKRAGGGGGGGGGSDARESVGESDKHMKWKSFAADRLEQHFEENCRSCRMEMELDAPVSEKDSRRADSIILFDERDEQLGQGVVIEVQHKNESKDIQATTRDYIDQDLAVVWATEDDFLDDRCTLEEVDIRHRAQANVWPDEVPKSLEWSWYEWQIGWDGGTFKNNVPFEQSTETENSVPASLPPEYFDDLATQYYRDTEWKDIFQDDGASRYIREIAATGVPGPVPLDTAQLSGIIPKPFWEKYKKRFINSADSETHQKLIAEALQATESGVKVPVTLPPEPLEDLTYRTQRINDADMHTRCPNCGSLETRANYGEMKLATNCRSCGDWFVFHKYGVTDREELEELNS